MSGTSTVPGEAIPAGPFVAPPHELGGQIVASGGDTTTVVLAWLTDVLGDAGVELAAYDTRIVSWLARTVDWSAAQVIAGWVARAHEAGRDGGAVLPAAPPARIGGDDR